jgi:hypothetical protein
LKHKFIYKMASVLVFKLTTQAKKTGGDKYTCETDESFVVYVPQSISRADNAGKALEKLTITIQKD